MQLKGTTKGMREIGRTLGCALCADRERAEGRQCAAHHGAARRHHDRRAALGREVQRHHGRCVRRAGTCLARHRQRLAGDAVGRPRTSRLAERPIKNPRAFELYLQAQVLVRRYGASMDQVNALLDRAIEIEGLSPPLRALRAYLWVTQIRAGMSTDPGHLDACRSRGTRVDRSGAAMRLTDTRCSASSATSAVNWPTRCDISRRRWSATEAMRMPCSSEASHWRRPDRVRRPSPSGGSFLEAGPAVADGRDVPQFRALVRWPAARGAGRARAGARAGCRESDHPLVAGLHLRAARP